MALNSQKLLPGSTFSTLNTVMENVKKQADPKLNIYKKVVKKLFMFSMGYFPFLLEK